MSFRLLLLLLFVCSFLLETPTLQGYEQSVAPTLSPTPACTLMIPMRDGKLLATDIYLPDRTKKSRQKGFLPYW